MASTGRAKPLLFLLLFAILARSSPNCDAQPQPPQNPHLFEIAWPPAFGRLVTGLNWYREGLGTPQQRERALLTNREVLQGPRPHHPTNPTPPPSWLLNFWIPGNYSTTKKPINPEYLIYDDQFTVPKVLQLHGLYGGAWLEMAAAEEDQEEALLPRLTHLYRQIWAQAELYSGPGLFPNEYYRVGAQALWWWLPVKECLEQENIVPHDTRPYSRLQIENALARFTKGQDHFKLFCIDRNQSELKYTPKSPRAQKLMYLNHTSPANMLYSAVFCVDPRFQAKVFDQFNFVPCPQGPYPLLGTVKGEGMIVPCEESYLYYYRTLDDGIEWPFLSQREREPTPTVADRSHLFALVWPPAYARAITDLNVYQELHEVRRPFWLRAFHLNNREALQGPDPNGPPPPWMLYLWLPSNYVLEDMEVGEEVFFPEISNGRITALEQAHHLDLWLEASASRVRNEHTGQTTHLYLQAVREIWHLVNSRFRCGIRTFTTYFRLGNEMTRTELPLGRWLAESGITPDDHRTYHRMIIETVLAGHLGGRVGPGTDPRERHFLLYCLDLNQAERIFTPEHMAEQFERHNHGPPNILYSVVVCVNRSWRGGDPVAPPQFAPCPEEGAPFVLPEAERELAVPCTEEYLLYVRTMNDGIRGGNRV